MPVEKGFFRLDLWGHGGQRSDPMFTKGPFKFKLPLRLQ